MNKYVFSCLGMLITGCLLAPLTVTFIPQFWYVGIIGALLGWCFFYLLGDTVETWSNLKSSQNQKLKEIIDIVSSLTKLNESYERNYLNSINSLRDTLEDLSKTTADSFGVQIKDLKNSYQFQLKNILDAIVTSGKEVDSKLQSYESTLQEVNERKIVAFAELKKEINLGVEKSSSNYDRFIQEIRVLQEDLCEKMVSNIDSINKQNSANRKESILQIQDVINSKIQSLNLIMQQISQAELDRNSEMINKLKVSYETQSGLIVDALVKNIKETNNQLIAEINISLEKVFSSLEVLHQQLLNKIGQFNSDNVQSTKGLLDCIVREFSQLNKHITELQQDSNKGEEVLLESTSRIIGLSDKLQEVNESLQSISNSTAISVKEIVSQIDREIKNQSSCTQNYCNTLEKEQDSLQDIIQENLEIFKEIKSQIKKVNSSIDALSDMVEGMSDVNAETNDLIKDTYKEKSLDSTEKAILQQIEKACKRK